MMKKNSTITFYKFSNQYTAQWEAIIKKVHARKRHEPSLLYKRVYNLYLYNCAITF